MAFVLYLLYLCSVILFLYIRTILMESILITGASGFIGSFIVEEALKRKFGVWAGIRSSSSKQYLKNRKIHFLELDFAHPNELRAQLSGHKGTYNKFDYIIHCAGVTKCSDKKTFDYVNYLQTKYFVDTLKALNMIPKQFIYISTLSVFGPVREKITRPFRQMILRCLIRLMDLVNSKPNFIYRAFPVSLMSFIVLQEFTVPVKWIIS